MRRPEPFTKYNPLGFSEQQVTDHNVILALMRVSEQLDYIAYLLEPFLVKVVHDDPTYRHTD